MLIQGEAKLRQATRQGPLVAEQLFRRVARRNTPFGETFRRIASESTRVRVCRACVRLGFFGFSTVLVRQKTRKLRRF